MLASPFSFSKTMNAQPGFSAELLRMARGQVGVREEGNNGGKQVRAFQSATWMEPGSWPWCAAFVCWCWLAACNRFPAMAKHRPETPSAAGLVEQLRGFGFTVETHPKQFRPGDVVLFEFSTGHHIGIAASTVQADGTFQTIEGNTSGTGSREGDGVYQKTRNLSHVASVVRL